MGPLVFGVGWLVLGVGSFVCGVGSAVEGVGPGVLEHVGEEVPPPSVESGPVPPPVTKLLSFRHPGTLEAENVPLL